MDKDNTRQESPTNSTPLCPICQEPYIDDDFFVHVYINHPEVSDNISKKLNGEPYKTAAQLRR